MNYENIYKDFSPLKFQINNDYIDKLQQDQPLIMSFDNSAMSNLSDYISGNVDILKNKCNAIYKKSFEIDNIEINTLKLFFLTFVVLYLVAPKFEILRVKDDINKNVYRPNMLRIAIITIIVSIFYLAYQGIDLLADFHEIIFA